MLRVLFYPKQNVRAFINILGMTMKAVAFEDLWFDEITISGLLRSELKSIFQLRAHLKIKER